MASVAGAAASITAGRTVDRAKASTNRINWEDFNWPSTCELLNVLHLDLEELREKRGNEKAFVITVLYRWWQVMMVVLLINFINTCIFTGTIDNSDIYPGINILYSFFNIVIGGVAGTAAWYKVYVGLGDGSASSLYQGVALVAVFVILQLVMAFGDFANLNGFVNLVSDRLDEARELDLDVAKYWTAMSVIEGLVWLVGAGGSGFGGYKAIYH